MNISDVNSDGIAMDGMDPVAYYNGEFLKGSPEFSFTLEDITYWFANEENQELFESEPDKYIPLGGGYAKGQLIGDLNAVDESDQYVGNQYFEANRGLEDEEEDMESRPHQTDVFEGDAYDDEVERDNLHDSKD